MKLTGILFTFGLLLLASACQEDNIPSPDNGQNPEEPVGSLVISLIEDEFEGEPVVIVGSGRRNFLAAFSRDFAGGTRTFTAVDGQLPIVMEDDLGNRWDVFGRSRLGPNQGENLTYINSGMGYWFVFGAYYPGLEIYGMGGESINVSADTTDDWGVPNDFVAQGAGFDAIRSVDEPEFTVFNLIDSDPENPFYLEDDDLVIGLTVNGESKAYPHAILDWHEVVNDVVGGIPVSVTYCPLTGTAKVWKRFEQGNNTTYGVSGLLYNSNILAFDRATESLWMQLEGIGVFGGRKGEQLELVPFVETTWKTWQSMQPSPLVMTQNTGFSRNYSQFPYGDYKTSAVISYPLLHSDNRLPLKERVFSIIINGNAKVYRLSDF